MARRLLATLEDYLSLPAPLDQDRTPFNVVRPNQQISTRASTLLRNMENYGKRAVKRQLGVATPPLHSSPRLVQLRLPSSIPPTASQAPHEPSEDPRVSAGSEDAVSLSMTPKEAASPVLPTPGRSPETSPELGHEESSMSVRPWRSLSLPTGIDRAEFDIPIPLWVRVFTLRPFDSCPILLDTVSDGSQHDDAAMAEILQVMDERSSADQILCALFTLLDLLKDGVALSDHNRDQCLTVVVKSLHSHLRDIEMAETCCRVLKYLVHQVPSDNGQDLEEAVLVVLSAMQLYSHCKRLQLSGAIIVRSAVMRGW